MVTFPSWKGLKSTAESPPSATSASPSTESKAKSSGGVSKGGADALVSRRSDGVSSASDYSSSLWVLLELSLVAAATGAAYCGVRYFLNLQSQRRRLEEEEAHYQRMLLDLDQQPVPPRRDELDDDDEDDMEDRYRSRHRHDHALAPHGDHAGATGLLSATAALINPVVAVVQGTVSLSFGVLRDAGRLWERLMRKVEQRSLSSSVRLRRTLDLSTDSSAAALLAARRRLESDLATASELLGSTHNLAGSALLAARDHLETEFREAARTITKLATSVNNIHKPDPTADASRNARDTNNANSEETAEDTSPEARRRRRWRQLRQRRRRRRQADIMLTLGALLVSSTVPSPAAWRRYGLHPLLTLLILTRMADAEEEEEDDEDYVDDLGATDVRHIHRQAGNIATTEEEHSSLRSSNQSPQPAQSHPDPGDQQQKQNPGEETRAAIGMSPRGKSQSLPPVAHSAQTGVLRFSPTEVSPSDREVMTLTAPPSPFETSPGYHLNCAPGTEGPSRSESFSSYPSLPFPSNQASQPRQQHFTTGQQKGTGRHLEILVHNVSHADMVLSLGMTDKSKLMANVPSSEQKRHSELTTESSSSVEEPVLCRPRFSAFDLYATRVHQALEENVQDGSVSSTEDDVLAPSSHEQNPTSPLQQGALADTIISYPVYERSDADNFQLMTPRRPSQQSSTPIGFDLDKLQRNADDNDHGLQVHPSELPSLRVRGRDTLKIGTLCDKIMKLHQQMQAEAREQEALSDARKSIRDGGKNAQATSRDTPLSPGSDIDNGDFPCLSELMSPSKMELQALDLAMSDLETARAVAGEVAEAASSTRLHINSIFFPILSTLLPRWESYIQSKYPESRHSGGRSSVSSNVGHKNQIIKQVLILVSGVGSPRHWTHSSRGNSTEACAKIMEIFVRILYPNITVVRIHSETNIFRYDDNISFAKRQLVPCVDAYRDAHARGEPYPDELPPGKKIGTVNEDWKQTFSVALSFADGSPARTHAIQAALRHYRPTYFHFWQLKTFWHEGKVCFDDLEVHSFEDMETEPAIDVSQTSSVVRMVVNEMQAFRREFLESLLGGRSDVKKFWLRKSKKPVLAVLLVDIPGKGPVLYRGTNMEVSMPTGSLCAERNVIGTALAANPGLKREDIKMVGVLAVPLPTSQEEVQPNRPPVAEGGTGRATVSIPRGGSVEQTSAGGASNGSVDGFDDAANFVSDVTERLLQLEEPATNGVVTRSMSLASLTSIVETEGDGGQLSGLDNITSEMMSAWEMEHGLSDTSGKGDGKVGAAAVGSFSTPANAGTPVRRIKLYNGMDGNDNTTGRQVTLCRPVTGGGRRKQQKTVVVHSTKDLNPLRPCGACNEWLKKIAESNPSFKVITFTDTDCNGVYVTSCDE